MTTHSDRRDFLKALSGLGIGLTAARQALAEAPTPARLILDRYQATVVACRGGRCEYVGFPSEENISNALLRLG